jgi:hypothetical protein
VFGAGEALSSAAERGRGERAGGEEGDCVIFVGVERGDLFAVDGDAGLGCDAGGDAAGELDAIDGEGVAGGDGGGVGLGEEERSRRGASPASAARARCWGLGLERVGADQLGEVGGLVGQK